MRFVLEDFEGAHKQRVTVLYKGSVPDLFRTGRDVVVTGDAAAGRALRDDTRVDDHEVPVEVPGRRHSVLVPAQAMQSMWRHHLSRH